jgi:hypothetical protein
MKMHLQLLRSQARLYNVAAPARPCRDMTKSRASHFSPWLDWSFSRQVLIIIEESKTVGWRLLAVLGKLFFGLQLKAKRALVDFFARAKTVLSFFFLRETLNQGQASVELTKS